MQRALPISQVIDLVRGAGLRDTGASPAAESQDGIERSRGQDGGSGKSGRSRCDEIDVELVQVQRIGSCSVGAIVVP